MHIKTYYTLELTVYYTNIKTFIIGLTVWLIVFSREKMGKTFFYNSWYVQCTFRKCINITKNAVPLVIVLFVYNISRSNRHMIIKMFIGRINEEKGGCFMNFCAFAFSDEFVPNYFLDNLFLFIVCTVLLEYVQLSTGFVQQFIKGLNTCS